MSETLSERAEEALDRYAEECRRHDMTRKERDYEKQQHSLAVAQYVRMEKERDAALARVRQLEGALQTIDDYERQYDGNESDGRGEYYVSVARDALADTASASKETTP